MNQMTMNTANYANTLCSLAMLKVNIDSGKDYLEYLHPYVVQVLIESPPEMIVDNTVAQGIRDIFGLEIPHRTIQIVLQRLAKKGYLKLARGIYTIVKEIPFDDTSGARADAGRHIASITNALIQFAKNVNRNLTEDEAIDCLIVFLSQFSIPCLKYYLKGTALPNVRGQSDWQITLVSQFVSGLTVKPELFDSFMKLVQGHMLANALLCPDLQSVPKSYKNVVFYFDTPLLIQILGLEGNQKKQSIDELIGLVQKLEGKIAYFSHTLEEIRYVINSAANKVDSLEGRGMIIDEARKSKKTKSDLILIAEKIEELLKDSKIFIFPTPPYDSKTYQFEIEESVFANKLDKEVSYLNVHAKEYDIKSVRSVYVLRQGLHPSSIEKSRAVFVTNNAAFAKAAYEYGKTIEQSLDVSTVITDFSLVNTAWLKAPLGASSLPQKEVMAFAYAAQRPTYEFWNKVLDETDKLEQSGKISARDHQLLRSSHHVQEELMKLTLGENEALTGETISNTLSRVTDEIRKEGLQLLQESEVARRETEQRLTQRESKIEDIKKKIYWKCDTTAKCEAKWLWAGIWIIHVIIAISGVVPVFIDSVYTWATIVPAILVALFYLIEKRWDITPRKIADRYGTWRRMKLLKREYANILNEDVSVL